MTKLIRSLLTVSIFLLGCFIESEAANLRVKTGESHRFRELLNVHESPISWISVGGKKYNYVKGDDPCYLEIPGRDMILFITSNESDNVFFYHFVSLKTGKEITMPAHWAALYLDLGSQRAKEEQPTFELIDGPKIVILVRGKNHWTRYRFDLDAKTSVEESR